MSIKSLILEEYKKYVRSLNFDPDLDKYKEELLNLELLKRYALLNLQFIYVVDITDFSLPFISDGVTDILGYQKEELGYDEIAYWLIHPDERDLVCQKNLKALQWGYKNNAIKPNTTCFSLNYQLRRKDGEYIKVLRQSSIHSVDNFGQVVHFISVISTLSLINHNKDLTEFVQKEINKGKNGFNLSDREIEIVRLLSQGKTSREIADELYLSIYTIENHRKNMLRKNNLKNSSELINKCKESGLI
jgi:DNA-binding CsgD family transcriptional regulator